MRLPTSAPTSRRSSRTWPTKRRRHWRQKASKPSPIEVTSKVRRSSPVMRAGITVTLPKPQTSEAKSEGRFGKQDFRYVAEGDIYICPAGEKLTHHFTNEENGLILHRYWTDACRPCALKAQCTKGAQRRIRRWEHEYVVDAVQARLDKNPDAMRTRRETVEHPFGTLKMRMGATHFLTKTLPKVATEMALHVL